MTEEFGNRRILYLYEAVAAGSVRGAADKLNVNASAVSRQIALLEDEVGSVLLERHNRGVKATEVGKLLIEYHRSHDVMYRDLQEKLRETRGYQRGHIAVALGAGFVSDLLGKPLDEFHNRYPNITFDIQTGGSNEVIRRVSEDEAHIGLCYHPSTNTTVRSWASAVQPLCAIVSSRHPLTKGSESPTMTAVADYPVILKEFSFGTMQLVDVASRAAKVELKVALTTNSSTVMFQFLRNTTAVAFAPAFSVAQEVASGVLRALPIDHPLLKSAEAHLITRVGRSLPMAAQRLLTHLVGTMTAFKA